MLTIIIVITMIKYYLIKTLILIYLIIIITNLLQVQIFLQIQKLVVQQKLINNNNLRNHIYKISKNFNYNVNYWFIFINNILIR